MMYTMRYYGSNNFDETGISKQNALLHRLLRPVTDEDRAELLLEAKARFDASCERCCLCGRNANCDQCPIAAVFDRNTSVIAGH